MRGFDIAAFQAFKASRKPFKNGGPVRGPGTGTSDSIHTEVPEGSYIMPADSSQSIGHENLQEMGAQPAAGARGLPGFRRPGGDVPVALSNGEHELPPEQVHAVGVQALEQMKDATHVPTARGFVPGAWKKYQAQQQEPRHFFASGGPVARGFDPNWRPAPPSGSSARGFDPEKGKRLRAAKLLPDPFHAPGVDKRGKDEPQMFFKDGGHVARGFDPNFRLKRATGGLVSEDDRRRQAAGNVAGAPGVQRTGNSYSDAPRAPGAGLAPAPSAPRPAGNVAGAPGVFKHGRGQYSDNPNGMGLPAKLGNPSQGAIEAADRGARGFDPNYRPSAPAASSARGFDPNYRPSPPAGPVARGFDPNYQPQGFNGHLRGSTSVFGAEHDARRAARMDATHARWAAEDAQRFGTGVSGRDAAGIMKSGMDNATQARLKQGDLDAAAAEGQANRQTTAATAQMQEQGANYRAGLQQDGENHRTAATNALAREKYNAELIAHIPTRNRERKLAELDLEYLNDSTTPERRSAIEQLRAGLTAGAGTQSAPSGYRYTNGGRALEAIPGGPADQGANNKPLNETQSKSLAFGSRMLNSGRILDELAADGVNRPGLLRQGLGAVGLDTLGNMTQTEQQQQVEQAQRDFTNAVLRRESGAAIADHESDNARKQYFPQVGDDPKTIEQKRRNREVATNAFLSEVPNADQRLGQVLGEQSQRQATEQPAERTIARTGSMNGRRVVQYSDGSVEYAD